MSIDFLSTIQYYIRMDEALQQLGLSIKEQRQLKGLSQEKLAELSGFDRTYISMLERAKRNPSYLNLLRLANALKIDICILFQKRDGEG